MADDKKKNKLDAFFAGYAESEDQLDFKMAHEEIGEKVPVIPTGSVALDDALSSGGLPKGRLIQYYGPPGCHKAGQLIMMSNGNTKKVEDIIIGDHLMGYLGSIRKVLDLKRGFGKMYKIQPIKGNSFIVNEDHILTLVRNNNKLCRSLEEHCKFELIDVSLKEYINWSNNYKRAHKLIRSSVATFNTDHQEKKLPLDPYILGVLIGDGSLMRGIELTSADEEIVSEFRKITNEFKLNFIQKKHFNTGKAETYRASGRKFESNKLYEIIKSLKLNITSGSKFIPFEYKTAKFEDRAAILAGLIDTDGSLSNGCIDYISKSQQLSEDVAFIARSLGLAAYITVCEKSAPENYVGTYYRVSISGDLSFIPTKVGRKTSLPRKKNKNVRHTGFSVEAYGEDYYYGFTLDGDGRYLLDDFTVTHNSGKTLMAMIAMVEAQRQDPTAQQMFIDSEQTFSPIWAETLGVDTSRVILVEGDTAVNGRKCFEMLLGVPKEDAKHILKGKSKEGFLDKIVSGDFNVNLIVLDSLGSIIPPGEDTSAIGKMNMSLLARFLTTTFRKLTLEVNKAQVPFIIINHKRDSFDIYKGDHTFSGGNTYAHTLSANVYFEAVQRKDDRIVDEKDQKVGHPIRATIEKSKFGAWPRSCEFKVNFGIGVIDKHEEIAQLALDYGVVNKTSSVSHEYGDKKWVGFPKFCEAIKEDTVLASELLDKVYLARESKLEQKRQEQVARRLAFEQASDADKKNKKEQKVK